ncbi:MAG: serine/threonine-protein phosphatase [Anaerolineae bacterium]|nr:serine/threonine-protein phosphatase [Anaerolineae bacterium]
MIVQQYTHASIEHPERNEDAVLILQNEGMAPVFAVIDGMGGHQHQLASGQILTGHDASQFLAQALGETLGELSQSISAVPGGQAEQIAIEAIRVANERLYNELNKSEELPINHRVGAVLTIGIMCENNQRLLCAQVGDTRAYLYSDEELIQLCYDEDNIEFMVSQGLLSGEDGARITDVLNGYDGVNAPKVEGNVTINGQPFDLYIAWRWFIVGNSALGILPSNIVLNALGIDPTSPKPQISRIEVGTGDSLLFCSDGLYKNMSDDELANALKSPDGAATLLGEAALKRSEDKTNQRRNPDDISVFVVTI